MLLPNITGLNCNRSHDSNGRLKVVAAMTLLLSMAGQAAPALPRINTNNVVNITQAPYDAAGDGSTDNTLAISNAIAAAAQGGTTNGLNGGTVEIPAPGIYLCGPEVLRNNVNLQIDAGAILRLLPVSSYPGGMVDPPNFLSGTSLTNIEISGRGAIDGQGVPWWPGYETNARPLVINLSKCSTVLLQNFTLSNAPAQNIVIKGKGAGNVTLQGLTILAPDSITGSPPSHNTDGLDFAETNCLIENCYISVGDDMIALGSSGSFTGGVLITNCVFGTGHGLSMGSYTSDGVSNVLAVNCSFLGTQYGLKGKSERGRGGLAQNVSYLSETLTNVGSPINFSSYYDQTPASPAQDPGGPTNVNSTTPLWQNILLSNITATAATDNGIGTIWGLPEAPVTNLLMRAVHLQGATGLQVYHARSIQFASDCSVAVQSGPPFLPYDAQLSTELVASNAWNVVGISSNGISFSGSGINGNGQGYSANALGSRLGLGEYGFDLGPSGALDSIAAAGQTLAPPTGLQAQYQTLILLAAAVNGSQAAQPFTIHYTDGSLQIVTQNLSDWGAPQGYLGEWIAASNNTRNTASGSSLATATFLYEYAFALNSAKTFSGVTLPNNSNVVLLSALVAVYPTNTVPSLTFVPTVGGQLQLSVGGAVGPNYSVQLSTNLTQWQTIFTTNPGTLPFTWNAPVDPASPAGFYRVLLGP